MKIYVGNLPFSVNEETLKKVFSGYETEEVVLIKDNYSGRSKGFGFVTINDDEQAKKAIAALHEKEFEGRKLIVNEARPKEDKPRRSFGDRDSRPPRRDFGNRDRPQRRRF